MATNAGAPGKIKGTSITTPTASQDNHTLVLGQLKETTEIAQRLRGDPNDSFVRVSEVVSALGARLVNNTLQPPVPSSSAVSISVAASITGAGTSGSPLQLVNDSASPGNNMAYQTNGSGVKGWYAAGGGGGGSISLTDGTNTVASVTTITAQNGVVGGTGTLYFPWSPDMPPVTPNSMNDEFDGTTLNSRWSAFNGQAGTFTTSITNSAITITIPADGGASTRVWRGIKQSLPVAPWTFVVKVRQMAINAFYNFMGFFVLQSSTSQGCSWGTICHGSYGYPAAYNGYGNYTTSSINDGQHANLQTPLAPWGNGGGSGPPGVVQTHWIQLHWDGVTFTQSYSLDGVNFFPIISATGASESVTVPDTIVLGGESISATNTAAATYDYFRRTA